MELTQQQVNALYDPNVEFFLLPTSKMKEMITANEHPYIKSLLKEAKERFLFDYGIPISTDMVKKFIEGTLDERNDFLLKLGEIRVFGAEEVVLKAISK